MAFPLKNLSDAELDELIAREHARVVAPLTEWQSLAGQLREEGILRPPVVLRHWSGVYQWGVRIMAGATLLGTGVLVGRGGTLGSQAGPLGKTQIAAAAQFTSPQDARKALMRAQFEYQHAASYLTAMDTSRQHSGAQLAGTPSLYKERLAALDEMMSATRNALKDAPQDPVLNQYYLSTAGAREVTLEQLNQSLPVGARLARY